MGGSSVVVAGEDGVEGHHAVVICLLDTTEVGGVPAAGSVVAGGRDATVRSAVAHLSIGDESYL